MAVAANGENQTLMTDTSAATVDMVVRTTARHDRPPAHPAHAHLARIFLCPRRLHIPDVAQRPR